MALEAVVFPQGHLGYSSTVTGEVPAATTSSLGIADGIDQEEYLLEEEKDGLLLQQQEDHAAGSAVLSPPPPAVPATPAGRGRASPSAVRRRRRRPKAAAKNKEEAESQRRNHIAVERNRRRQMNDYLAVLRSVMPPSYAQRGDQASIVAGAINFVKELEQLLQSLEAQKRRRRSMDLPAPPPPAPFARFFTFPQFSSGGVNGNENGGARRGVADVEVAVAESHANVKLLAPRRRPSSNSKQLLRMVLAMRCLGLTVLHLNATTADHLVFYSFSLKMEDECRLSSADEVAAAVHQMVAEIVAEDDGRTCQASLADGNGSARACLCNISSIDPS